MILMQAPNFNINQGSTELAIYAKDDPKVTCVVLPTPTYSMGFVLTTD